MTQKDRLVSQEARHIDALAADQSHRSRNGGDVPDMQCSCHWQLQLPAKSQGVRCESRLLDKMEIASRYTTRPDVITKSCRANAKNPHHWRRCSTAAQKYGLGHISCSMCDRMLPAYHSRNHVGPLGAMRPAYYASHIIRNRKAWSSSTDSEAMS